jgi:hypothetical protein
VKVTELLAIMFGIFGAVFLAAAGWLIGGFVTTRLLMFFLM